ncbi:MAG: glutathionylspermidine synthase family protein [Hyphomicrobiaceae bacterium]|nr:glutathionylspermidine synthase family protein [Hyphomicrobiaceae bacterium]
MQRISLEPRSGWQQKLAELGMDLGDGDGPPSPYWAEDAAYVLAEDAVEALHIAIEELAGMVETAVGHVVEHHRFAELGISDALGRLAAASWEADEPSLYGRFDLRWDGRGPPKLLEYNADTPTALFEASVVQWHWLEERFPDADQYNSIHEGLIETWRRWGADAHQARVHFACVPEDDDDLITTAYLQDTCIQAGLEGRFLDLSDLGWDGRRFVDLEGDAIAALFKLYPWDWMAEEPFFEHLAAAGPKMLEPAWRVVAASKGILAVLWELFPGHPCLLPAAFDPSCISRPTILKPLFGREGANILVEGHAGGTVVTDGPYEEMRTIAQAFHALPEFDGWHPVVGAWMIGGEARGIGIREERSLVTGRGARFVPHLFEKGA